MSLYEIEFENLPDQSLTDKAIVLDLDETLVHTFESTEWIKTQKIFTDPQQYPLKNRVYKLSIDDVVNELGEGVLHELAGVLRPHLMEFILFLFFYFRVVCVWSAGKQKYVHEIVRLIFRQSREPHLIFSYNDCKMGIDGIEKPLEYMYNIPGINKLMNAKNTFVIDDRNDTFVKANPGNAILIPEYKPETWGLKGEDNSLIQLINWFCRDEVINSEDVRLLDKSNVFKLGVGMKLEFNLEKKIRECVTGCTSMKCINYMQRNKEFIRTLEDIEQML